MHSSNLVIAYPDEGIARAEANGLLHERDPLLYRPGVELAPAKTDWRAHEVVMQCERRLVFGNGFLPSFLSTQRMAFCEMRRPSAGRGSQGWIDQPIRGREAGRR